MIFLSLVILMIIMYIFEGYHDSKIELVQKTNDIKLIEAWHGADTWFHVFLNISVSFGMFVFIPLLCGVQPMILSAVVFGIMMMALRQLFMTTSLNRFRNRKTFYIGTTSKFDKKVNKYGKYIYGSALLILIFSIYYFLKI